jgi:chloride channel 7
VVNVFIYMLVWYIFMITTYGVAVPAGIFLPGMLVGCSLGLLYLEFLTQGLGMSVVRVGGQSYLVMGASAMMSSYTRLTYSLAVVMMETTQSINMFLPILITIAVAHATAMLFNRSMYDYAIRGKQIPILGEDMPKKNWNIRVKDALFALNGETGQHLQLVESVCTVERLSEVLQAGFNTIPVANMHGSIIGMVPKNFVITLIEN